MVKVNIHGSCVSRDIFRFDKEERYKVETYIGRNSIISSAYPPVSILIFDDVTNPRNLAWEERMLYFDCNKNYLEKLVSDECDYLVIDLIDERFGILESEFGKMTYSQVLQRSPYLSAFGAYTVRDVSETSEEFYDAYEKYAIFLRRNYDVNKIIIHEAYPVTTYIGKDKKIHLFDEKELQKNSRVCKKIKKGYELLKKFLPEAYVLHMPPNTIAYEEHMWGKATVHYSDEYYTTALMKITEITEKSKYSGIYPPYSNKYNSWVIDSVDKKLITQEAICIDTVDLDKTNLIHRFFSDRNGYHYELFLYKKNSSKLYVVFGGARTQGGKKRDIPYFNRWTYYTFLDGSLLVIEDPMFYKYPELLLGWFYGTKEENGCREGLYALIQDIMHKLHVNNDGLIFYSSSGGGTVAIHMASLFPGSTALTLNPQISLSKWSYANEFNRILNISLDDADNWKRNEPYEQIKLAKDSSFVICVNEDSESDMEQLKYFCNSFNCNPVKGINQYDNLLIWIYSCKTKSPHTAFETHEIFWPIAFLGCIIKNKLNISEYLEVYSLLGDLWKDIWNWKAKYQTVVENGITYATLMDASDEKIVPIAFEKGIAFKPVENNYQYIKILDNLQRGKIYKVRVESKDYFIPYELAIYDFEQKKFLAKALVSESITEKIFLVDYNCTSNSALLLYNGRIGETSGNHLFVDKIQISIIANNQ